MKVFDPLACPFLGFSTTVVHLTLKKWHQGLFILMGITILMSRSGSEIVGLGWRVTRGGGFSKCHSGFTRGGGGSKWPKKASGNFWMAPYKVYLIALFKRFYSASGPMTNLSPAQPYKITFYTPEMHRTTLSIIPGSFYLVVPTPPPGSQNGKKCQ